MHDSDVEADDGGGTTCAPGLPLGISGAHSRQFEAGGVRAEPWSRRPGRVPRFNARGSGWVVK